LGVDGMPGKLIKEGLKQLDQIKVSFEKGTMEITGHVAPNQAQFGAEYFLAYTLPDFKSKIFTQISGEQKDDGPLLFSLMGQCFQDLPNGPASLQSNIQKMQIVRRKKLTNVSGTTLRPLQGSQTLKTS
jgi:hypothetical protein